MGRLFYLLSNPPMPVLDLTPKTALQPFRMADLQPSEETLLLRLFNSFPPLSLALPLLHILTGKSKGCSSSSTWSSISRAPSAFSTMSLSDTLAERSRFLKEQKMGYHFICLLIFVLNSTAEWESVASSAESI